MCEFRQSNHQPAVGSNTKFSNDQVRMFWMGMIIGLIVVSALALALGAWYMFAVPGRSHRGPLPAATAVERDLAERLGAHVTAIASSPHNLQHYEALEDAAQYIEHTLEQFGYVIDRQVFSVDGSTVRNIEATREPGTITPVTSTLVVGAH